MTDGDEIGEQVSLGGGAPVIPNDLVAQMKSQGFTLLDSEDPQILHVGREHNGPRSPLGGHAVPIREAGSLSRQLDGHPRALADHFGFFSESGYFELMVTIGPVRRGAFDSIVWRSLSRLEVSGDKCDHDESGLYSIDSGRHPGLYPRQMISGNESSADSPVIHVANSSLGLCVELSPQSACGVLFGVPNFRHNRMYLGLSIKVTVGSDGASPEFVDRAHDLANSFMYELAVRNRIVCEPIGRAYYERDETPRMSHARIDQVRFPAVRIESEVAELYSFAERASDNLPLAFLSFYQVLEYFFPQAVRKDQIRKMRREISDPRFAIGSDADLVRLVGIAEESGRYKEADQISTLLESATREDRLREFFAQDGLESYFGRNGRIAGVRPISLANRNDSLAKQVADRVYQLRNRIVHAKDDPKYLDQKVLLPRSSEAMKMRPDVDLLRLLAQDVILDAQI